MKFKLHMPEMKQCHFPGVKRGGYWKFIYVYERSKQRLLTLTIVHNMMCFASSDFLESERFMDGANQQFFIPQHHCDCWDTLENGKDVLESQRMRDKGGFQS